MELEQYLAAIKSCSDERLYNEFGVYDNWPIFCRAKLEIVVADLQMSKKYALTGIRPSEHGLKAWMNFTPGTIDLNIFANVDSEFFCRECPQEHERMKRDYDLTIFLHQDQRKKMDGVSKQRALVIVICDLSRYLRVAKIPFCFPKSRGLDH